MSPFLYHESLPITRVIVHTTSPESLVTEIQNIKTSTQIMKKKHLENTFIRSAEIQVTNSRNKQTQITEIQIA